MLLYAGTLPRARVAVYPPTTYRSPTSGQRRWWWSLALRRGRRAHRVGVGQLEPGGRPWLRGTRPAREQTVFPARPGFLWGGARCRSMVIPDSRPGSSLPGAVPLRRRAAPRRAAGRGAHPTPDHAFVGCGRNVASGDTGPDISPGPVSWSDRLPHARLAFGQWVVAHVDADGDPW
jgi:hypothetical protein